jgi:2-oxo-4-hydroxy-4-carboxy-5-ureidoimidazoline decarboxylase
VPLDRFNALGAAECAALLRTCLDVPAWAARVAGGRPYGSVAALTATARTAGAKLDHNEVRAALARHPRIGERPPGESAEARLSRAEQSNVDASAADRLREANARYEARFGHIFLIRAAGRSAEEILATLERRLSNDPAAELDVVRDQLTEIAVLRLESAVGP